MNKISEETRRLILSREFNHEWDSQGFCVFCNDMHRTDWRPNDLCRNKIERSKFKSLTVEQN